MSAASSSTQRVGWSSASSSLDSSNTPDPYFDSDDEEENAELVRNLSSIQASVFEPYQKFLASQAGLGAHLKHVKEKIEEKSSCLVCLGVVASSAAVWQCQTCYTLLHLSCIQNWVRRGARRSSQHDKILGIGPAPWLCPKCRAEHPDSYYPDAYLCYCGKTVDPPVDLWVAPHSCGQVCGKSLGQSCPHHCVLLCHPGRCPPCPQTVQAQCFCRKKTAVRRCDQQQFSCGFPCSKPLDRCGHACPNPCHDGPCEPCAREVEQRCHCGSASRRQQCSQGDYSCDTVCGRPLPCGNHVCEKVCHPAGQCQACPGEKATCHCGKEAQQRSSCLDPPTSCLDTCNKLLSCGRHRCFDRCHKGDCMPCRARTQTRCACGASGKVLPCGSTWTCKVACKRKLSCGVHACGRRCCDRHCPPCSQLCQRQLNCGNHKCTALCHPGQCLPCPITASMSCPCGRTTAVYPCATAKRARPPKCELVCNRDSYCHHDVVPHPCHKSICPHCKLVCDKPYADCPHQCKLPCHDPLPPVAKYTKKDVNTKRYVPPPPCQRLPIEQVQCPACPELVQRWCYGRHDSFTVVCSTAREFPCTKRCDHPLLCSHHTCELDCHPPSPQTCRQCDRRCAKPRPPRCKHTCPLSCHPGDCPPCDELVKYHCYCLNNLTQMLPCSLIRIDHDELDRQRSCRQACARRRDDCSHACGKTCHKGPCALAADCTAVMTITCKCGKLTSSGVPCQDVRAAQRQKNAPIDQLKLLDCDDSCAAARSLAAQSEPVVEAEPPPPTAPRKRRSQKKRGGNQQQQQQQLDSPPPSVLARLRAAWSAWIEQHAQALRLIRAALIFAGLLAAFIAVQLWTTAARR